MAPVSGLPFATAAIPAIGSWVGNGFGMRLVGFCHALYIVLTRVRSELNLCLLKLSNS